MRSSRVLPFFKLSGAGNDFVLIDRARPNLPALARRLCDRRGGIGADGLLVLERGNPPRLRYFNADGSAAFCGNGLRCAALWLREHGRTRQKDLVLATAAGLVKARVTGPGSSAIRLPEPRAVRLGLKLEALGVPYAVHAIDTGVPHAVIFVPGLDQFPVVAAGRALRRHKAFAPAGANVDFVSFEKGGLSLRTYERGVEDETLACGTGAAAAAIVAHLLGRASPPVSVRVRGGDRLTVSFRRAGPDFSEVWLDGPARVVYTGEIHP